MGNLLTGGEISYAVAKTLKPQSSSTCKAVGPDARAHETGAKSKELEPCFQKEVRELSPVHKEDTYRQLSARWVLTWTKTDDGTSAATLDLW